ncbi:MAG: Glycosyltransferase [candidate division TM6 bacterium GW2011_GWF2_28_16]|nr:MAG: Glycosyltransferase [candidate division TM6 bacterium GW2011_GWF2_28_16]
MAKPKIAILTIRNSYKFGGVLASVHKLYQFCEQYFDPTVFYLSFDPKISVSLKKFNFKNDIRKVDYFGMNAVEVGAKYAFWEPGHYEYSLELWKKALQGYDYFFIVSGSNIAGYPLVQLNKKYALSVATVYQDDREQRVKSLSVFRKSIDIFSQLKMKKIEKEIFKNSGYTFTISNYSRKRIDQILGINSHNLAIYGFPVNVKVKAKQLSQNKNIIAVGRFADPRKNFDMLMQVFKNIYTKDNSIKLYVVGDKPSKKMLDKFNVQEFYKNIIFTGNLNQNELDEFYGIADLMLITSYQEGLGIIGLEAMAYGLPVVSTNCGGTSDYVINNKTGYLVDINDDKLMAEYALYILNSPDIYKNFSENALNFIKDNYSEKKFEAIIKYGLITVYPELSNLFDNKVVEIENSFIKEQKEINI